MLFGRKKPGFVQVVSTGKESEDIVLQEKNTAGRKGIEGAAANGNGADGNTAENGVQKELLDYLTSLPDAEDEFAGCAAATEADEAVKELTQVQKLAEYIRLRSSAAQLTAYKALLAEDSEMDGLLAALNTESGCEDIMSVKGEKDIYYYSTQNMSGNYAMIAALVEEKDLVRTMAHMARWNCKTYPAPTPLSYFERHPYYATKPQFDRAVALLTEKEEYADVKLIHNSVGIPYLFSTEYMSVKYARSLTEAEEFVD